MSGPEPIFDFDKPPILLLGSGISRRYSKESPDWHGLLARIAFRIGISKERLVTFEEEAREQCNEGLGHLPMLATILGKQFRHMVMDEGVEPGTILDETELKAYVEGDTDAIKIMVASEFSKLRIQDDPSIQQELEQFRRLSDIIPCIITTNYDRLIESDIMQNRFKVYSKVSDYYLSGSQGIGEIFKIHGTCDDPSTIVINQNDYLHLAEDSKIVTAKILSVLCDYPMLIMGYSLEDADVKGILDDLISSLDDEKLREVEKNIVYVSYKPGLDGFRNAVMNVEHNGHRMSLRAIETDNFEAIFREIGDMEASASPMLIRRLRQLVKKIVITDSMGSKPCRMLGISEITDDDIDRLVLAVGPEEYMKAIETIPVYTVDTMVKDIMSGSSDFVPKAVVDYFLNSGPRMFKKNQYVPIFHFIRRSGYGLEEGSKFLEDFIREKNRQFESKLSQGILTIFSSSGVQNMDLILDVINSVSPYQRPLALMQCYDKGIVDERFTMDCLRSMYNSADMSNSMFKSNFLCALTFISFKELGLKERSGQGTADI